MTTELQKLAKAYLDAHAAYKASEAKEPLDEDGNQIDEDAPGYLKERWLSWYEGHKPIAETNRQAGKALAEAAEASSTHPWTLVPIAESYVAFRGE